MRKSYTGAARTASCQFLEGSGRYLTASRNDTGQRGLRCRVSETLLQTVARLDIREVSREGFSMSSLLDLLVGSTQNAIQLHPAALERVRTQKPVRVHSSFVKCIPHVVEEGTVLQWGHSVHLESVLGNFLEVEKQRTPTFSTLEHVQSYRKHEIAARVAHKPGATF